MNIPCARQPLFVCLILAFLPSVASADNIRQFGANMSVPLQLTNLPTSRLKTKLQHLPATAQKKALAKLRKMTFSEKEINDIHIDNAGGVFIADSFLPPPLPAEAQAIEAQQTTAITEADAFSLHSRPGARNVIYLDFNGMDIKNTAWNDTATPTLYASAFDTDNSPTTFSAGELNSIVAIWHRIAEDFMPFNVDVTTQSPRTFGSNKGRILITKNVDKKGVAMPASNSGGVAYVGVWGYSVYGMYSPALVYYNNLGGGYVPYVAEAASHEMGHNLGLSHDGTSAKGYYEGLGAGNVSWAPIMGTGYTKQVTEWSKGEYPDANNKEDDIAIIRTNLGYRPDDHAGSITTATPLVIDATGKIEATNQESDWLNTNKANKGIIGRFNDADYFSFNASAGPIKITVTPAWDAFYVNDHRGANLDVQANLYAADGKLIQTFEPTNETKAVVSTTVAAGQYYLAIRAVGNTVTPYSRYASLGQYFIRGTVTP